MHFFAKRLRGMFLLFLFGVEHADKKAEMCGDRWRDQNLVMFLFFLIYTSVIATRVASTNEEKTLRAIYPSCYLLPCFWPFLINFRATESKFHKVSPYCCGAGHLKSTPMVIHFAYDIITQNSGALSGKSLGQPMGNRKFYYLHVYCS